MQKILDNYIVIVYIDNIVVNFYPIMKKHDSNLYILIWQTRRLFQRLRATSDKLLENSGINASQRAVLEFLYQQAPSTVPQIAQEKAVSRQHIQLIVNGLLETGFVTTLENPAHKRSPLIALTKKGSSLFKSIHQQELQLLKNIEKKFTQKELKSATNTLRLIDDYLASDNWKKPE